MQTTLTPPLLLAIVQRVRDGLEQDHEEIARTQPRLSYQQMEEAIAMLAAQVDERDRSMVALVGAFRKMPRVQKAMKLDVGLLNKSDNNLDLIMLLLRLDEPTWRERLFFWRKR